MLSLPMAVDLGPEEVAAVVDMVYAATRASVRA
jgi:hypothetical protein